MISSIQMEMKTPKRESEKEKISGLILFTVGHSVQI